ncbi:MAG: glycosyltransferase family 4 protein [Ignavibacteriae bacterium]|nr:glycosyltransferase family 4 protein [Ignavibacteriota bacterium]
MRILFVLNYRKSKSGITEQVLLLKRKLVEKKFDVNLVNTYGSIFFRIKGLINAVRAGKKCDLIIGNGCSYFGFYPVFAAAAAAFFLNKRVIFNYHGGQAEKFLEKNNFWLKQVFGKNKIIVASDFLLNVFKERGYPAAEKIDNIFDFENFPGPDHDVVVNRKVVWARSFERLYRPDMALSIAEELTGKYDCEFHFYGDGSLLNELKRKYRNSRIIFHGLVERETLLKEFMNYSVLMNTTLMDNIPNTIFEAGFYDLLVISSRVGGINTTFGDQEIAFVENNTREEYIKILSDYFEQPEKFTYKRKNLRDKILGFDWNNVKEKWLDVINHG